MKFIHRNEIAMQGILRIFKAEGSLEKKHIKEVFSEKSVMTTKNIGQSSLQG